jgi:hypothetical protein
LWFVAALLPHDRELEKIDPLAAPIRASLLAQGCASAEQQQKEWAL